MVRLLISTGEVSGDLQGSLLIAALRREADRRGVALELLALGGSRMEAAGAELLADTAPMGAIGLWEAVPLILPTLRLQARVDRHSRPLDGVVLIDYVGANVRLGRKLRSQQPDLPITYYIAPQEWAWPLAMAARRNCWDSPIGFWRSSRLRQRFMQDVARMSPGSDIHCWTVSRTCLVGLRPVGP